MKEMYLLVVDFGTSNVRSILISAADGEVLCKESLENVWLQTEEGRSEMDPELLWEHAQEVIRRLLIKCRNIRVAGIGFSFFGDALLPVDENLKPLSNMIMAFDTRAQKEASWLKETIGEENFKRITGGPCLSMLVCSKLLWLKEQKPQLFEKAKYFLHIQEYILEKLGFGVCSDYTMAGRKAMLEPDTKEWSKEILSAVGISKERLGDMPHPSTYIAGRITRFGNVRLPYEIPVVLGGHDSECGILGLGIAPEGSELAGNVSGTYEMLGVFVKNGVSNEKSRYAERGCGFTKDGTVLNGSSIAGSYIKWYQRELCRYPDEMFSEIEKKVQYDGRSELYFLADHDRQEFSLTGIGVSAKAEQIYQAVIEGITFKLKSLLDEMEELSGKRYDAIVCGGGGSASDKWLQFKADLFGKKIVRAVCPEASALGAAMITAVGVGCYQDFTEAIPKMVRTEQVFTPDRETAARYAAKYAKYRKYLEKQ